MAVVLTYRGREDDAMRIAALYGRLARRVPPGVCSAYPGNTASILVFSVAALNGLTM